MAETSGSVSAYRSRRLAREIFHVRATRSIDTSLRQRRRGCRGLVGFHRAVRDNFSEDAVSNCIPGSRENRSSFRHPDYSHPVSLGRYPAPYLMLEIGLSVMRAAADTLSKLTSDISVFHREAQPPLRIRASYISFARNRLPRFYVCTLGIRARCPVAGSSRSAKSPLSPRSGKTRKFRARRYAILSLTFFTID